MKKYYPSDSELIHSYQDGDSNSFGLLYEKHYVNVFKMFFKYNVGRDESKDLSQELFIKVSELILEKKYSEDQKFTQWISRVTKNMAIDYLRKQKRHPMELVDPTELYFENNTEATLSKEDKIIYAETMRSVKNSVNKLDSHQKQVLLLRFYGDLPFKKIADLQKVSINTATGRMRRALANLKRKA